MHCIRYCYLVLATTAVGCAVESSDALTKVGTREAVASAIASVTADERERAGAAGDETQPPAPDVSCSRPASVLRAATFNAGLAPNFVDYAEERQPLVIQALSRASGDLDVLCVQEFWRGEDFDACAQATAGHLPHVLRRAPRPGSGTCTAEELTLLGQCLQTHCAGTSGGQLAGCAASYCASEVATLSGGCLGCIMNHLEEDLTSCLGPGGAGDPAVFGGAYDVGLLSRYPLLDSEVTHDLDSYFVRMTVLYARVAVAGRKPVHVFCTHLGSSLGLVPYAGVYASWQDEHLHQVSQLREYIDAKAAKGEHVVVLGDMNAGPDSRGLVGEWPENYAVLVADDLVDHYLGQPRVTCTWCPNNALVDDSATRRLPDHILTRRIDPVELWIERFLDQPIWIRAQGTTLMTNLSDHYGLKATLRLRHGDVQSPDF
jgi:endonuclease/exonuclease/phosphatase family metal-dependent hydrolase